MDNERDQTSEALNQIFEIINAEGDTGELKQIVENKQEKRDENTVPNTVPVTAHGHFPPQADSEK